MPVTIKCDCGLTYELKDEFARRSVKCPQCGAVRMAPALPTGAADPAFARDKFLLRQKAIAINEKYQVWDEAGKSILFVERPTHLVQSLIALLGGALAAIVFGAVFVAAASAVGEGPVFELLMMTGIFGGFLVLIVVIIVLSPKRHVSFYRDETRREKLLEVLQDSKLQVIIATYTIRDHRALILGRLRKNYLYNLFRKRWECLAPNGSVLAVAREDSIILSLLRRLIGPLLGLLRTNFVILRGSSDEIAGEFNRKMTLLDRYVLDLARDPGRRLDRRIMLALGVMLDTGERR